MNALGPNERREFWRELEVYAQVPRREADKAAADEAAAAEANAGMKPEGK